MFLAIVADKLVVGHRDLARETGISEILGFGGGGFNTI